MPDTILEAIRLGFWDFEPKEVETEQFEACGAMPGTAAKLTVLAERIRRGLPLWHPADRQDCDDMANEEAISDGWPGRSARSAVPTQG